MKKIILAMSLCWLTINALYAAPARTLNTNFNDYANQQAAHDATLTAPVKSDGTSHTKSAHSAHGAKINQAKQSSPININQASENELAASLSGVGPAKARAIIEYRQQHGPFKTVDALIEVKGNGPATLDKNRAIIRLN